ncbi:MAG: hypothetical protein JW880_07935 [Candidatus Thermoplasmatota archaeon]|nr:hypothetical protein [Candidatus Thermoplasmatota archaeon]
MGASDAEAEASDKRETNRPVLVSVGIALFVVGFVITVVFSAAGSMDGTVSSTEGASDSEGRTLSPSDNLMAFLGVFLGLLGVVTATIGPLTTVVIAKGRR